MAKINFTCECGRPITVDIITIDKLRSELEAVKAENKTLKAKVAAMEMMKKMNGNPLGGAFDDLFGGRL